MLDEKTLWQALDDISIKLEEWTARKEFEQDWPVLRIYIETNHAVDSSVIETQIHEQLKVISPLYFEAINELDMNPLKVTLLPRGSFQRFYEEKRKAGADLAHLKPPHMNASESVIRDLKHLSGLEVVLASK